MVEQGLRVQTKTEQLLYKVYPRLVNFPKAEKFMLSQRIKNKNKSKIFPISQGVNTIGFKIHPTHRLLRNDCKKKIKRKLKAIPNLLKTNKMTELKAGQMIGSWAGHAKHGCSYNFVKSLVDRYGIVSQNKQGNLCFPN